MGKGEFIMSSCTFPKLYFLYLDCHFLTSHAPFLQSLSQENKNDLLQIVCGYHRLNLPERGSKIIFQPLDHMQPIEFRRFSASDLGLSEKFLDHILKVSGEDSQVRVSNDYLAFGDTMRKPFF